MALQTRKATHLQSSPTILMAGVAGAGKTWAAIEASSLEWVDRTFFIEIGESSADAYGVIEGSDYEIVVHDGTIGSIRQAISDAAAEPAAEGKTNMLIIDSLTEVWELLKDNAQAAMMDRVARKHRKLNGKEPKPDMDLWARAGDVFNGIMRQLGLFPGPVICTARLDEVTSMEGGRPIDGTEYKIQAHKRVTFHCHAVLEARSPRAWVLTKCQTANPDLKVEEEGKEKLLPGFTIQKLFDAMNVGPSMAHVAAQPTHVDGVLNDKEPQQQSWQQQPQQRAEPDPAWLEKQHSKILELEATGDVEKMEAVKRWYADHSHGDLVMLCQQVLKRMREAARAQAVDMVQETLDGQVLEGEVVA